MKIKTNNMQQTLEHLYNILENESKVVYVRFGDGDFNIMSNTSRCIEHAHSPELERELLESFEIDHPQYVKGAMLNEPTFNGIDLQPRNQQENNTIINFIQNKFKVDLFTIYSHVLFTYACVHQQDIFLDFLNTFIRPKKKMFVGSVDKESMEKLVGKIDYYVKIPVADVHEQSKFEGAYYSIDEWYPKVLEHIDDVDVVLPTAGMAGRVLCKRLWNLDKPIHVIELGSIVDAVIGKKSRSWISRAGDFIKPLLIGE
jgi:hypothetical protein